MSLWRDTKIYYCLTSKQLMGDILRLLTMLFDSRYRRNSYYAIWLLSMGNMLTISFKMGYTSYVLLSMLFDSIYSYYVIWQETYLLYCLTEDVLTMVDVRCTCYVFWSDYTYYVVWWNILLLCHLTGNMLPLLFDGRYLLRCLMWDIIAVGFFFGGGELYILCCLIRDILTMSFDIVFQVQFPAEDVIEGVSSVLNQVIKLVKGRVPLL